MTQTWPPESAFGAITPAVAWEIRTAAWQPLPAPTHFKAKSPPCDFTNRALAAGDVAANYAAMTSTANLTAINLDTAGTLGLVTLNSDGTFTYDANGQFEDLAVGETGTDTFTYDVDNGTGITDTATVTITVHGQNDDPTSTDHSFTIAEGGTATQADLDTGLDLLSGVSDPDTNDTHTVDLVLVTGPSHGSLILNTDGTFSYTHNDTENFSDSFTYRIHDSHGGSTTATVTIVITEVNDNAPIVPGNSFTVDEGATATEADLDSGVNLLSGLTDSDLPFDSHTANVAVVAAPVRGSLTINSDGTFSYTHDGSRTSLTASPTESKMQRWQREPPR